MRIAIYSFYSGINNRGVERWVNELGNILAEKHEIDVFQSAKIENKTRYSQIIYKYSPLLLKCNKFNFLKKLFLDCRSIQILFFTIKTLPRLLIHGYDIVIPTDGGWEPAVVRIVTLIKRMKMVVVGHAGIGWDDANNIWSFPDIFVALSTKSKQWVRKVNPFVRCLYIPDGVNLETFTKVGKKYRHSFDSPVVLSVGALEESKGHEKVIDAVSKIQNVSLLICGRGKKKNELLKKGHQKLGKRFQIINVSPNEMPMVYRSCDLLVCASSKNMAFEMVILEALACGTPVIANDDSIRKEIAGEFGVYVDVSDSTLLSSKIKEILQGKNTHNYEKQAELFDWKSIARQYENLFDELVQKPASIKEKVL